MTHKQPAYIIVFTIFGLSTLLGLGYGYLAHYQQKMRLMHQFQRHQQAALVYHVARKSYAHQPQVEIETNLGAAHFIATEQQLQCDVTLKQTGYKEKFRCMLPEPAESEPKQENLAQSLKTNSD